MLKQVRSVGAALVLGATLASGVITATPASAQSVTIGDGLVNVQVTEVIDNVTVVVQDINIAVPIAAKIAANVCGVKVGPVAVLGRAIDLGRQTSYSCNNTQTGQGVNLSQN